METGKETGGKEMIWLCLFVSDFIDYHLAFTRFSGHTKEFQLIKNKMEVCHG
jgi:hypothetical protein